MANVQRWQNKESLGEGGQAYTFIVTDSNGSGDILYVKKRLKNLNSIARFKREIEAIRNLSHENVVNLVDFDLEPEKEKPYFITEYCQGGSLSKAVPFWRDNPIRAIELFQEICAGVAAAHNASIVHRDLKPDNVFLRNVNGPAVVGDFGICHIDEDGSTITLTDEAVGAQNYMAPELEDGRNDALSSACDIYSLGKLLYWLITGRMFSREKFREPQWDMKGQNLDSLTGWNNVYLEHVNDLLDNMIVPDPTQRFSISQIQILIKQVKRLVQKEYNPVSANVKQPCVYCGKGCYVERVQNYDPTDVRNFGYNPVGSSRWRILTCGFCGHVQSFRADYAHRPY